MKKNNNTFYFYLLALLCCLNSNSIFSQNESEPTCGTMSTTESQQFYQNNRSIIKQYEQQYFDMVSSDSRATAANVTSLPIKAHIIRTSAGTGGLTFNELTDAIDNLNSFYSNAFIEFFLCDGINYIDDDTYYTYDTSEETALTAPNNVPGLINIYFTDDISSASGPLCGYAYFPGGPDTILMANNCTTSGNTLAHEVGHFFALAHTHGPVNGQLTSELVDGSNCDTDGDQICDTAADPQLSNANVNPACLYTGNTVDANGDTFVPDPANIMSYSRRSCRNLFSPQQYARIYATQQTTRNYFECPTFHADFIADTPDCQNPLTINFTDDSAGAFSWEWDIDGDNVVDYTSQNPSHTYSGSGTYDVTLTVYDFFGQGSVSKYKQNFITVSQSESLPMIQSFETISLSDMEGWSSVDISNDGYFWTINSGGTSTANTGPVADNTIGTVFGTYIYAEASGLTSGAVAGLVSPCIDITSNDAELEFAYHMFGANIGELHVDIDNGSGFVNDITPPIIGQQQSNQNDSYLIRTIDLSAYDGDTVKIRFRAVRGNDSDGDIAIDDVSIKQTLSIESFNKNNLSLYPNPANNVINIKTSNSELPDSFEVYNMLGQLILNKNIDNAGDLSINTSSLQNGMYFIKITKDNKTISLPFLRK